MMAAVTARRTPWWWRPGRGRNTRAADAVRGTVAVFAFVVGVRGQAAAMTLWVLAAGGGMLFRGRDVPPGLDLAGNLTMASAAALAVLDAYARNDVLDVVLHFLSGGVLSALVLHLAAVWPTRRRRRLPAAFAAGASLGCIWELLEWVGHVFVDPAIHISYVDTMTDIAAGALGAVVAALPSSLIVSPADPADPADPAGRATGGRLRIAPARPEPTP